jgi:hypothetical protein
MAYMFIKIFPLENSMDGIQFTLWKGMIKSQKIKPKYLMCVD